MRLRDAAAKAVGLKFKQNNKGMMIVLFIKCEILCRKTVKFLY